ncbi:MULTISPECIES: hypothetical protein [unclassified Bradyrhizobium]|uniref:hypothetical protein n=1 Tax=Bradyrhizobium sp. USDA 4541 TaxID=2817704 RepID=UPI0020A531FB|nr:hypothetical protein [Bradyrhizobium sp. USDA 4541]MCP1848926.1 hypothetical protein [Bradyrhizobium sp. USDA 4541]
MIDLDTIEEPMSATPVELDRVLRDAVFTVTAAQMRARSRLRCRACDRESRTSRLGHRIETRIDGYIAARGDPSRSPWRR